MTFDPFCDFETRGYLRNLPAEKDSDIVRRLEHTSFMTGLDDALAYLAGRDQLAYGDLLETHRVLFEAVYPWAGQDRMQTAPGLVVSKGSVMFAYPQDIRRAVDHALHKGQDKAFMTAKPGEVMGYLAFGHPFLDGNGRAIMVLHAAMAQRVGIGVDWAETGKKEYLDALTREIETPSRGNLDDYLKPFIKPATKPSLLASRVAGAPGLDGNAIQNTVLGKTDEPAIRERYQQQELKRRGSRWS